jgi:tetratricopeptide (TPR) repeat protein
MDETSGVITSSSMSEAPVSEARVSKAWRSRLDFILAGCICVAAVCYWLGDSSNRGPGATPPPKASAMEFSSLPSSQPMEKDRASPDDFNNTGFQLYSSSNYMGAEAEFRKAIRANPKGAVGFCNLGAALIAQRRFDEAIIALQTAISLNPSLTLAQNNFNWAHEEKAKRRN